MRHDELVNVGSLVSQVNQVSKVLLTYFEQDTIPEESIEQLREIQRKLRNLLEYLVEISTHQELEAESVEMIRYQSLIEWKDLYNKLLQLLENTIKIAHLHHITEIEDYYKRLGIFLVVEIKK